MVAYARGMGIFDKAREAVAGHVDQVDPLVGRLADEADGRTGGQRGSRTDRAADPATSTPADRSRRDTSTEPDPTA